MEKYGYRFSFGPWNIHTGADPFGPPVRAARELDDKLDALVALDFDAVQFHDDDAVAELESLTGPQVECAARELGARLVDRGVAVEFVAPRLWEHPRWAAGAFTASDPAARAQAVDRARLCADIARALGTDFMVIWLAREGSHVREARDPVAATRHLAMALDAILTHDPELRIAIEPKPNEPMDQACIPTVGHALALGARSAAPGRVGVLVESAHAILAGLDPAEEMGFALALGKLWSVHLNDQNGPKFDQDRAFGSVDLRRAFNQVRVLDEHGFRHLGMVGFDVKALRTQPAEHATKHLRNSLRVFLRLVAAARSLDRELIAELVASSDLEELDWQILAHLGGW